MLADKDRIFTNLYGEHDWHLAGARRRGVWDGTKELIHKGRDWIVNEIKESLGAPTGGSHHAHGTPTDGRSQSTGSWSPSTAESNAQGFGGEQQAEQREIPRANR